jgi:hypothetical protein
VHEDQQVDHSLVQLQQDLQEQLQQHQFTSAEQPAAAAASSGDGLSASMHSAAADTSTEDAVTAAEAAAGEEAAAEPAAAAAAEAAAAAVPASTLISNSSSKPASCYDESEWHLVSPNGSVRLRGPASSRGSFDYAGISPRIGSVTDADDAAARMMGDDDEGVTSCCSGSDTETTHTPKDDLAASILGHSVLMRGSHFGSAADSEAAAAAEMQGSDDGMDALRAASMVSSEGGIDGLMAAAAPAGPAAEAAAAVESPASGGVVESSEVLTGLGLLGGEVAQLVGAAQGSAAMSLQGLREWLMESLAALVQVCGWFECLLLVMVSHLFWWEGRGRGAAGVGSLADSCVGIKCDGWLRQSPAALVQVGNRLVYRVEA